MKGNLANIYACITRKYGSEQTVTFTLPPTYLNQIVGENEANRDSRIVLVYIEDENKAKNQVFISPSKINIKNSADLDLTGSPLKDDCVVDALTDMSLDIKIQNLNPWKVDEECQNGIPIAKARMIISDEEIQKSADPDLQGSVWFLCDGSDNEKTLFLQFELKAGCISRGLITFLGVCPSYTVNTQTLLKQHFQMAKPGAAIETFMENTYQIKSNIFLRCSWSSVANVPSLIDLSKCDVTLHQKFQIEDCAFVTKNFIYELRILMNIRDEILAYNRSSTENRPDPQYKCGSGIELEELKNNVNAIMTEISGYSDIDSTFEGSNDIEEVVGRAKIRSLLEVTDKLWELLKGCASYKDLKMAFNIIFQCAARCNLVNTPLNKNRLAEIITEIANRRLAIPCLSGSEPLELLLEIGLEKLYKDYEFILSESKICSASVLKTLISPKNNEEKEAALPAVRQSLKNAARQPEISSGRKSLLHTNVKMSNKYQNDDIMLFRNSNFDEKETAIRLARLLQIHCTLEHILMIHINLNIPNVYPNVCEQLMNRPLRFVDYIHDSLTDEMEISLDVQDIREHLEGKDPYRRRISIISENKLQSIKTTFFYSMDNICPPGVMQNIKNEEKEYSKENNYYTWLYRKIIRYRK